MSPRTIVVTGASGFLGSWVVPALAAAAPADRIVGIGRRSGPVPNAGVPNFDYRTVDLLASERWISQLPGRADAVLHLAGDGRTSVNAPEWFAQQQANIALTSRVIDYAQAARAATVLYASSVYVYSGVPRPPFVEQSLALPVEQLGATKLAAEALLSAAADAGCFHALSLRIFTAYGPRSREEQFVPQVIRKLLSPEPVARFRTPERMRDFVYAGDVGAAFVAGLAAQLERSYEAVNIGSGTPTRIKEMVALLARLLGARKSIEFLPDASPRTGPSGDHWADVSRSRTLLGWQPAVSLEEGVRRTVESYLSVVGA